MSSSPTPDVTGPARRAEQARLLLAQATTALTAAARVGADMAEFVANACAAAAANAGGIEHFLAGRPGSWEASLVRQLLTGTLGEDDEALWARRTEPAVVVVNIDDVLCDLDIWGLYRDDTDGLIGQQDAIGADDGTGLILMTDADETAFDQLDAEERALDEQRSREWTAYGQAFRDQVLAAAARVPGLTVPVEVVIRTDHSPAIDPGQMPAPEGLDRLDSLEWLLEEAARASTPLPGSGIAPADYPHDGRTIAQAERDAGRTPLARLRAASTTTPATATGTGEDDTGAGDGAGEDQ